MKKVFIALLLLVFVASCKKDTPAPTTRTNSSSSSGAADGILRAIKNYQVYNDSAHFVLNSTLTYFLSDPMHSTSLVNVGSVKIDTITLQYDATSKVYTDTTYHLRINPTLWTVVGANSFPSFTYTNNDSVPGYSGLTSLPDSIDRTQNLNLHIDGLSGVSSVSFLISDGVSTSSPHTYYNLPSSNPGANNTYVVPASSLSGMTAGGGSIVITLQKFNMQSFSGKKMNFISEKQIYKNILIK